MWAIVLTQVICQETKGLTVVHGYKAGELTGIVNPIPGNDTSLTPTVTQDFADPDPVIVSYFLNSKACDFQFLLLPSRLFNGILV